MKNLIIITKEQLKEIRETNEELFYDICIAHGQPWQWAFQDAYETACELIK